MRKLIVSLKREYWEYRRIALGLPIILSILIILASSMATMSHHYGDKVLKSDAQQMASIDTGCWGKNEDAEADSKFDAAAYLAEVKAETPSRFMAFYIGVAWLVGLYYLLSSLYRDRKDSSVLYWKSLPVSETENVLLKLVFGVFGFASISILIGWLVYCLLWIFNLDLVACVNGGNEWHHIDRIFDAGRLLLAPWVVLFCGLLWGAPVFTYVLMVSSMARRLPFFLLVLPPLVLAIVERIVFGSRHIGEFVISHTPFSVVHPMGHGAQAGDVWQTFMIDSLPSMLLGLFVSVLFLLVAVHYRSHRFEL